MSRRNVLNLLAGLAIGAALLFGAGCEWGQLSAFVAALGPGDALFGALSLVLAAMTGAAGVLIAADVRADIAAASAWRDIHAGAVVIATPAETAPTDRVDVLYVAGLQDDGLRWILLAHRFEMPVHQCIDVTPLAPAHGDALGAAQPAAASNDASLQIARVGATAASLAEQLAGTSVSARKLGPLPITSNAKGIRERAEPRALREMTLTRHVANAGIWWDKPPHFTNDFGRAATDGLAAEVIVLAHRNGRDDHLAHRDVELRPATTAQPGCRGPPAGASQRQFTSGPVPIEESFRERDQPRIDAPADVVVSDNLGDRVPLGAAELEVVERYLDDVLGELLAVVASGQNHGKS